MWTFVFAGITYLIGVGVVLVIRPKFMFTPDGNWKEFGIGQREDRYTPFPFWLFCLIWALVSYFTVLIIMSFAKEKANITYGANVVYETNANAAYGANASKNSRNSIGELEEPQKMQKGYYVLNKKATKLSGVPKYVYLGEEEPSG